MASRLLLDTHVVLWALQDPGRLGAQRALLEAAETSRLLSAVVVWEVAIKVALGRLELPLPMDRWWQRAARDLAAELVPIEHAHAAAVADLPRHHGDPFDRLLVAQARILGVPLVSADPALHAYDVEVLAVP